MEETRNVLSGLLIVLRETSARHDVLLQTEKVSRTREPGTQRKTILMKHVS
jgi:hypothetical protein